METALEITKKRLAVAEKIAGKKFGSAEKRELNETLENLDGLFASMDEDATSSHYKEWHRAIKATFKKLDEDGGTDKGWLALLDDARALWKELNYPEDLDGSGGTYSNKPTDDENTKLFFEIITSCFNLIFQNQAHVGFNALTKKANDVLHLGQVEREKKKPDFKPLVEKAFEFEKELAATLAKTPSSKNQIDAVENAAAAFGDSLSELAGMSETVTIKATGHQPVTMSGEKFDSAIKNLGIEHEKNLKKIRAENAFPVPDDYAFDEAEAEYIDANDLRVIAEALIQSDNAQFWHLEKVSIRFAWKRKGGRFFGKCESVTGSKEFLSGGKYDFLIWLAADNVRDSQLDRRQVEALVCHELCHIGWREKGIKLVHHDFEDFYYVVRKYGAVLPDLELAKKAFNDHQPSLFE